MKFVKETELSIEYILSIDKMFIIFYKFSFQLNSLLILQRLSALSARLEPERRISRILAKSSAGGQVVL